MIAMIDSNASSINVTIEDLTLFIFSYGEHMNMERRLEEKRWEELEHLEELDVATTKHLTPRGRDMINDIADFIKQYDVCYGMQDVDEMKLCYQNLIDNQYKKIRYPEFLTKSFTDEIENKSKLAKNKIREIWELQREWQRVADDLYMYAYEKASNAPEHLKRVSACNICEFLDEKRNLEEAIEHEKRYSKKYGVTNLSKIESYKQSIMQIDELIPQQKKEYKKYSGKTFDTAQCRNKKLIETCGENEDKLQKEIRRIIEERINTISQDSNKKRYFIKYLIDKTIER